MPDVLQKTTGHKGNSWAKLTFHILGLGACDHYVVSNMNISEGGRLAQHKKGPWDSMPSSLWSLEGKGKDLGSYHDSI